MTLPLAENIEDLQKMLNNDILASKESDLSLNNKNTKYTIISMFDDTIEYMYAAEDTLENVLSYNYLGTNVNNTADCYQEIKIYIEKVRAPVLRMKRIFEWCNLHLGSRIGILNCYIFLPSCIK